MTQKSNHEHKINLKTVWETKKTIQFRLFLMHIFHIIWNELTSIQICKWSHELKICKCATFCCCLLALCFFRLWASNSMRRSFSWKNKVIKIMWSHLSCNRFHFINMPTVLTEPWLFSQENKHVPCRLFNSLSVGKQVETNYLVNHSILQLSNTCQSRK